MSAWRRRTIKTATSHTFATACWRTLTLPAANMHAMGVEAIDLGAAAASYAQELDDFRRRARRCSISCIWAWVLTATRHR